MVNVLSKVSPAMMRQVQEDDQETSIGMCYVKYGKKPSLAQSRKIK